ncbi:hypothetical protein GCM10010436_01940 [Paractinoplanes durhamensis]
MREAGIGEVAGRRSGAGGSLTTFPSSTGGPAATDGAGDAATARLPRRGAITRAARLNTLRVAVS